MVDVIYFKIPYTNVHIELLNGAAMIDIIKLLVATLFDAVHCNKQPLPSIKSTQGIPGNFAVKYQ